MEYRPLNQGDTWTYQRSSGETSTETVIGTEMIDGMEPWSPANTSSILPKTLALSKQAGSAGRPRLTERRRSQAERAS
jgi:hypothetical protein